MGDELLPYYNDELTFIRRLAAEFADTHPKIAARLRLSADVIEDPHVGRLIEAFAYLNARVRRKLDDDFPELSDGMLGVLYPHYQAPIPSMAIVQMSGARDLTSPYTVPAGTPIETDPIDGEPCRFRTSYPVTLWPIEVESAKLSGTTIGAPPVPRDSDATSVLRIVLRCASEDATMAKLAPEQLRLFLRGESHHVYPLYELLFNHTVQVAVTDPHADEGVTVLGKDSIRPVGFDRDESLLPYSAHAFLGYRLLTEFFTFPQKFLFFDLIDHARGLRSAGRKVELWFYLNRRLPELEHNVSADTFALGCTPIVNLYRRRAEPIQLTHTRTEYRVVPDARRPRATEVYSIDRVIGPSPDGEEMEYLPFYGVKHAPNRADRAPYWKMSRRPAAHNDPGTEVYLSLVDLDLNPNAPADGIVSVEATCLNRDLPSRLPFGGGEPRLQLSEGAAPVEHLRCLTPPTRTLRSPLRHGAVWRLTSHLTLNHLSISGDATGAQALREILKLYDFADSAETRAVIESVLRVHSRPTTARVRTNGRSALAQGVEVTVEFDEERFSGSGLYLFASTLEHFLGLYCSVNSFTQMIATVKGREGALRKWPPRAGARTLV